MFLIGSGYDDEIIEESELSDDDYIEMLPGEFVDIYLFIPCLSVFSLHLLTMFFRINRKYLEYFFDYC